MLLRRGARRRGARGGERLGVAENEEARRARGRMPSHRGGRVATTVEPCSAASRRPCLTARVSSVAFTKGALGLTTPPPRRSSSSSETYTKQSKNIELRNVQC